MPRLNLNHDLQYDFNERLVAMCEVPEDEILYHPLGGFPLEVIDCDLPMREPMNMSMALGWNGYRRAQKIRDINPYNFAIYVVENNIGKDFNNAYRYFCKFARPYQYHYFTQCFNNLRNRRRYSNTYGNYWINDLGIIEAKPNRNRKYWYQIINIGKGKTFKSFDYEEEWLIEKTETFNWWGGKNRTRTRTFTERRKGRHGYMYLAQNEKKLELLSTVGHKETFDNRFDPKYQRLRQEDDKRYRKQQRELARQKKQIVYSFLTKEEKALKEEKLKDQYNLYRHGFDDDSFKGEHYHGRKNKKSNGKASR